MHVLTVYFVMLTCIILGYYKDIGSEGWMKAKQEQAKAKPLAIKANKSLVKIPHRGGGGASDPPAAKKPKTGLCFTYSYAVWCS